MGVGGPAKTFMLSERPEGGSIPGPAPTDQVLPSSSLNHRPAVCESAGIKYPGVMYKIRPVLPPTPRLLSNRWVRCGASTETTDSQLAPLSVERINPIGAPDSGTVRE